MNTTWWGDYGDATYADIAICMDKPKNDSATSCLLDAHTHDLTHKNGQPVFKPATMGKSTPETICGLSVENNRSFVEVKGLYDGWQDWIAHEYVCGYCAINLYTLFGVQVWEVCQIPPEDVRHCTDQGMQLVGKFREVNGPFEVPDNIHELANDQDGRIDDYTDDAEVAEQESDLDGLVELFEEDDD